MAGERNSHTPFVAQNTSIGTAVMVKTESAIATKLLFEIVFACLDVIFMCFTNSANIEVTGPANRNAVHLVRGLIPEKSGASSVNTALSSTLHAPF